MRSNQDTSGYKLNIEGRLTRLETIVTEIKNNHLAHIEKKIDAIMNKGPSPREWEEHLKRDEDHEKRIRLLERYGWVAIGGLYIINIAIGLYVSLHH